MPAIIAEVLIDFLCILGGGALTTYAIGRIGGWR